MNKRTIIFFMLVITSLGACSSIYYSFWEVFGKQKRDLLRDYVASTREDQVEVKEEFQDALTVLQATYPLEDSDLKDKYFSLKAVYDDSNKSAEQLRNRIAQLHKIALDLFEEWEDEANSITNGTLRQKSLRKLSNMRVKYDQLRRSLVASDERLEPVLTELKDHTLYLKHSLNSSALSALEGEARDVEREIDKLVRDVERAIEDTDDFLLTLSQE
jgi:hypothetical protein